MSKIQKICGYGFVIITFALLLYRITLHADVDDEIMNLNIAYRMSKGDIPFYNIMESYQMGAIFLAPFVWFYVKITGGTTGIVLSSRFLYIIVLTICAILTYHLLQHYLKKDIAFFISYIIIFFELFGLFYLWYDSEAIIFLLLGDLAIIYALELSKSNRKRYFFLMLAGIAHSCMALAHISTAPMAIGIAIILAGITYAQYEKKVIGTVKNVLAYASFPLVMLVILILLLLITGNMQTMVAFLADLIGGRQQRELNIIKIIIEVKDTFMVHNIYLVQVTKLLLIIYALAWIFPKTFPVLALGMIALPIYNQMLLPQTSIKGVPNYIAYLALWSPLLYLLIKRKEKIDRCMMYILTLPIFISAIFIPVFSISGDTGPIKAWQMFLPGMITTLYFIARIWQERFGNKTLDYCKFFCALATLSLLYNVYSFNFKGAPMIDGNDTRLTEGIYAGIKVKPEIECMVDIQRMVEEYSEGCETILASKEIRPIYLMTDLKPFTATTEYATVSDGEKQRWYRQMDYFKKFNALPDIMFLEYYDLQDESFEETLDTNFELLSIETIDTHEIYVYKKIMQ